MKLRVIVWIGVPVFIGVSVYGARTGMVARQWATLTRAAPVADYPARIDLGEREIGEQATANFTIANRGGGVLMVDQIRANCSCSALERDADGRIATVESLRLEACDSTELRIRVAARGRPDASMHNLVQFPTNDPTRPTGTIEIVVPKLKGGLTTYPAAVLFGTVLVGAPVLQLIDVYDTANVARKIEAVTSSDPDRLTVRALPPDGSRGGTQSTLLGTLIGHLEVGVQTGTPGVVDCAVQICTTGMVQPDPLRVAGRVSTGVEAFPSALALPLASGEGPIYSGSCLCRGAGGKPLTLFVAATPLGLSAEVLDAATDATWRIVKITWDPKLGSGLVGRPPQNVRLRAVVGDRETVLDVPVTCRRESPR
jgi:hypothetical protein